MRAWLLPNTSAALYIYKYVHCVPCAQPRIPCTNLPFIYTITSTLKITFSLRRTSLIFSSFSRSTTGHGLPSPLSLIFSFILEIHNRLVSLLHIYSFFPSLSFVLSFAKERWRRVCAAINCRIILRLKIPLPAAFSPSPFVRHFFRHLFYGLE